MRGENPFTMFGPCCCEPSYKLLHEFPRPTGIGGAPWWYEPSRCLPDGQAVNHLVSPTVTAPVLEQILEDADNFFFHKCEFLPETIPVFQAWLEAGGRAYFQGDYTPLWEQQNAKTNAFMNALGFPMHLLGGQIGTAGVHDVCLGLGTLFQTTTDFVVSVASEVTGGVMILVHPTGTGIGSIARYGKGYGVCFGDVLPYIGGYVANIGGARTQEQIEHSYNPFWYEYITNENQLV